MKKTYFKPETIQIEVRPHLLQITSDGKGNAMVTPVSTEFEDGEEFASRRGGWFDDED